MNPKDVKDQLDEIVADSDGKDDFSEKGTDIDPEIYKRATGKEYESIQDMMDARSKVSFWKKIKLTWQGKTKVGKVVGTGLDIVELFAPKWAVKTRDVIQTKTTTNMNFTDKMKKVRNWISWNDKDGNFSWQELGKSLLKIALAGGIVYGLNYFGLWEAVSQILG